MAMRRDSVPLSERRKISFAIASGDYSDDKIAYMYNVKQVLIDRIRKEDNTGKVDEAKAKANKAEQESKAARSATAAALKAVKDQAAAQAINS